MLKITLILFKNTFLLDIEKNIPTTTSRTEIESVHNLARSQKQNQPPNTKPLQNITENPQDYRPVNTTSASRYGYFKKNMSKISHLRNHIINIIYFTVLCLYNNFPIFYAEC